MRTCPKASLVFYFAGLFRQESSGLQVAGVGFPGGLRGDLNRFLQGCLSRADGSAADVDRVGDGALRFGIRCALARRGRGSLG